MGDELYQWYSESGTDGETRSVSSSNTSNAEQEHEHQRVRMIAATAEGRKSRRIELILDSGADVSLAPSWMKGFGRKDPASAKWTLRDAQGGNVAVQDTRVIEIMLQDSRGNQVKIEEVFLIANVINPVLAVGKVFQRGWQLLRSPKSTMSLKNQKSSFPVQQFACYYCICQKDSFRKELVTAGCPGRHEPADFQEISFQDPSMMYPGEEYSCRATLLKEPSEACKVLEYNCLYSEKEDPFEVLPILPASEPGIVLTVVSTSQIVPNMVGRPYQGIHRQQFEECATDYWSISVDGTEVVRHHFNPRRFLL